MGGTSRRALIAALAVAIAGGAAAPAADVYEIGVEDVLRVVVLGQAELTGDFTVDRDGMLVLPVLGKVKAADLTAEELERKLTTLLADGYLKRPQVSVSVKEYRSQRVFVTGQVQRPGPYALKGDRSLLALLADVGTLTADAGHEIVVIRRPEGAPPVEQPLDVPTDEGGQVLPDRLPGAQITRVSLLELQAGNPERNLALQAGDTVYVPRAAQVYVTGLVARQGPYRYQEGMTVLQAITLAGGVTERGSNRRIKVIRIVDGQRKEVKVKLADPVLPEDTIVVPERFF